MKRIIILTIYCLIGFSLYSQQVLKLNKNIKLDTLRIWVNYPTEFDKEMISKYDSILDSTLNKFNESASFIVEKDSLNPKNRIIMNMGSIRYVDTKHNILSTGISLALIGGHVFMISAYSWTIPVWPILLPATVSEVNLMIDNNLIVTKPTAKTWINSNGYLTKKEKQNLKFEKNFGKDIYKFLNRINKQNIKNNKP